ncbi:MAG: Flp pilus assembly protein CpaB [Caulobacteraceae bacterium]
MNPVRFAILGVALVAAIGLAVLLRGLVTPKAPPRVVVAAAPTPSARVLVAARDLAVGERLNETNMTWQPWPAEALNASFITDGGRAAMPPLSGPARLIKTASTTARDVVTGGGPAMQALSGAVVREAMVKGEPIIKDKVVRAGDGSYMSVVLDPGTRAVAVAVSAESGAGGFIEPGDRVDLVQAIGNNTGSAGMVSQTVLTNVRVLAVDQTTAPVKNGKSMLGATLTLEVPQSLVEMVAEAKARGGLTLALRSYADIGGGTRPGDGGGHGIRLFRGGAPTQVMVSQ